MKIRRTTVIGIAVTSFAALAGIALAAQHKQDWNTLQVPDGLAFSEFKGYDKWQVVAVSETKTSVKAIVANPIMIRAYKEGVPANGKLFPDGSKIAKIEWLKKVNTASPYFVEVPESLKSLSFIEKDSKRFPNTRGWAYAQFQYTPASATLKPSVTGAECGFACHSRVEKQDNTYTAYPLR